MRIRVTESRYGEIPRKDRLHPPNIDKKVKRRQKAASTPFRRPRRIRAETSYKPSSVSRIFRKRPDVAVISLGMSLPTPSSTPPVPTRGPRAHRAGRSRSMHGTACACTRWGLPCPVRHRTGVALLPHHFNLTCDRSHIGGVFSVALSLTRSPRAGGCYPPPLSYRARTFLAEKSTRPPARLFGF